MLMSECKFPYSLGYDDGYHYFQCTTDPRIPYTIKRGSKEEEDYRLGFNEGRAARWEVVLPDMETQPYDKPIVVCYKFLWG